MKVWRIAIGCIAGVIVGVAVGLAVPMDRAKTWIHASLRESTPVLNGVDMLKGWPMQEVSSFASKKSAVAFVPHGFKNDYSYVYGFAVADFDGDGRLDISFADSWSDQRPRLDGSRGADLYMLWHGDRQPTRIATGDTFDFSASPVSSIYLFERQIAFDLNGDGLVDIVGVVNSHDAVIAYLNPGKAGGDWKRQVISKKVPGAVNLLLHDMNGDGLQDILVTSRWQTRLYPQAAPGVGWLENPGPDCGCEWKFHPIDIRTKDDLSDPRTLQVADINGDGRADVVVSDARTGKLTWYEGDSEGRWVPHVISGVDVSNAHFGHVVDMNGDGRPDIVAPMLDGLAWLENVDGGKTWVRHQVFTKPDSGPVWTDMNIMDAQAADIDGDGQLEIVFSLGQLAQGKAGSLHYAKQNVGGDWEVFTISATEQRVVNLNVVDYNGDGRLDIVANTEGDDNAIVIWLNEGAKTQ